MLTCVHHPIDPMRVVEREEAERLYATGVWFDSPAKAKLYKAKVEEEIANEALEAQNAAKASKTKLRGKQNERQ